MLLSVTSFSLLAPLLLLFLGLGQTAIWWQLKKFKELLWLGSAFVAIGLGVMVQVLWRPEYLPLDVLTFTICYFSGFTCVGLALARRMQVPYPWRAAWVIAVVAVGVQMWLSVTHPNVAARVFIVNAISMALSGLPLIYWRSMQMRNRFDVYLRWLYVILIALNSLRLLITLPLSWSVQSAAFTQTWFWFTAHIFFMALCLLLTICMFSALLHDVLAQLRGDRSTDALTMLPNRRGWDERIAKLQQTGVSQAERQFGVLVVDIDHFKQVNDRFGHAAGDAVLQAVAKTMRKLLRSEDIVCRFGGEEFIVLLVDTTPHKAKQVAERIRQHVQTIDLLWSKGVGVSASIGLSIFQTMNHENLDRAMKEADAQMYLAKNAGRNKVSAAEDQQQHKEEKIAANAC